MNLFLIQHKFRDRFGRDREVTVSGDNMTILEALMQVEIGLIYDEVVVRIEQDD
jgi:hypothetical protein